MDKNDEKQALLDTLNSMGADTYTSWADLYARLHEVMAIFKTAPGPLSASMAILTMYSFIMSLEELPDEGDVRVIARHMNEIMVMRSEQTGMQLLTRSRIEEMVREKIEDGAEPVYISSDVAEAMAEKNKLKHLN